MAGIQRSYRDRLFLFLFGREERKDWALWLYNAVNRTDYNCADAVELTTLGEVLYLGMHNDVSMLLYNVMSLYEQQSTYNPNMPVRFLMYMGRLYEKYIHQRKLNIYGKRVAQLPVPKFVVFYNGAVERPEEEYLWLSDAFANDRSADECDMEIRVRVLNINHGQNQEILKRCQPLAEYAWLTDEIRENQLLGMGIERAVDAALAAMPESFLIRNYLLENKAEVKGMVMTEYDEDLVMELMRAEGRAEGLAEGQTKGREEGLFDAAVNLAKNAGWTLEQAMAMLNIPADRLPEYRKRLAF